MLLQTPMSTSRLLFPAAAGVGFLVISHFTYLLSFPLGQFPYGYHTAFNVALGMTHNLIWIIWSLCFVVRFPKLHLGSTTIEWPRPYPPRNPLDRPRQRDGMTPLALVICTTFAMALELLDFAPFGRIVDAHSLWHAATIPIALGWWTFMCNDAIELEGSLMGKPATVIDSVAPLLNGRNAGSSTSTDRRASAELAPEDPPPRTPDYISIANGSTAGKSPKRSPGKDTRQD